MKLYNFRFGPYPQRVSVYLAEKGISDFELIEYEAPSSRITWPPSDIKFISKAGSLPIVVDDDGTTVTQSLAILEYLEDTRPGPDMRGATAAARARTREFIVVLDDALTFSGLWAVYGSDLGGRDKDEYRAAIEIGATRYFKKLRLIDSMMKDTKFIASDSVTTADCVAIATLQYMVSFYEVPIPPDCHRIKNWYDRFSLRPSAAGCKFPPEQHNIARQLMAQTNIVF